MRRNRARPAMCSRTSQHRPLCIRPLPECLSAYRARFSFAPRWILSKWAHRAEKQAAPRRKRNLPRELRWKTDSLLRKETQSCLVFGPSNRSSETLRENNPRYLSKIEQRLLIYLIFINANFSVEFVTRVGCAPGTFG